LRLFEDLRGFAAPLRLERRTCHLPEIIQRAWETAAAGNLDRGSSLVEIAQAEDLHMVGDPFQLEQVFRNLFENSLAACHGQARVEVEFADDRTQLEIRIRDNGPGIPLEARQKMFEPFFTTKVEGTGLGMAIVERIVSAHEGRVELEDREGPGAEFRIILPKEEA
jgi:two-component system, LuxR family, sensor kinase FixL